MKQVFSYLFFFFCTCVGPQYLSAATGTVEGAVTDSITSLPISGALVEAVKGNQVRYSDTTALDGSYSLTNVQPGNYTLIFSSPGYRTQTVGVKVKSNQTNTVDIELVPNGGTIDGTVTDAITTLPIPGATVNIFQGTDLIQTATTNGIGFYSVPNLSPGNYIVEASAAGYQQQSIGARVQAGFTTTVDFALITNPGAISGTVTDAITTNPIIGALVQVFNGSVVVGFADTDGSGNYTISDLAPGNYAIAASAEGYQSKIVGASVTGGSTTTVEFALEIPPGTIEGTVTDATTGTPIPGASITVFQGVTLIASVLTDSNGQYSISEFAPGDYLVRANANLHQQQVKAGTVAANATTSINFALNQNPGAISGQVTDAVTTDPIAGATINVYSGQLLVATALTDPNGNYQIPNLSPDNYIVTASKAAYQTQAEGATVTAGATTIVNFALIAPPGAISGTVTDAVTTNPIVGARVSVFSGQVFIASALTDANGNYTIPDLAPGQYTVIASAGANYQAASQGATVVGGMTTTVDFALQPNPGTIAGTVTEASTGNPIPGASINVFQGATLIASALTDINGQYSISEFAPGDYLVSANANLHQQQVKAGTVAANATTTINFALNQNPGAISGQVTDAVTTDPIAGATINVYSGQLLVATALTDPNGNYQIPNLSPDNYIVTASKAAYQTQAEGATVTAGATTIVNFALIAPPGAISGTVTDAVTTNPIVGARVSVFSGQVFIASALTDANGSYTIPDLAPGQYTVIASAGANYQAASQGATVVGAMTTTVDFALQPNLGAIAGTVTNEASGVPIPGASILVLHNFTIIDSALTDANGNYSIIGLAPGNYTVIANAPNFSIAIVGGTVTANNTTIVNFALKADLGKIFGTVTDATTSPIPGATIQVRNSFVVVETALTDANGNYNFPNLPPGTYSVTVSAPGFQRQVKIATVTSNQVTVVNFALNSNPGIISGTVTDAVTTNPIPDATVAIFQGTTFIDSALTDVNGSYIIPDLAPGNYTVLAIAQGYQAAFSAEIVIAGMTTTADFALNSNPGTVAGTVTDGCGGAPLSGVIILVMDGSVVEGFGLTDSNGNYSIDTIAPGNYTVTAAKNNFLIGGATATVTADATTIVNFSLTPTILPPTSISGCAIKNEFLTQTDLIHVISWTASPSSCVTGYQVFRNGKQIAFVPSTSKLEYHDHNRNKKTDAYSVKAVNSFGLVSDTVSVTVGPKSKCPKK